MSDLEAIRARATAPTAMHGCTSDPCGSVICQTARDRDQLLDALDKANEKHQDALAANQRYAHKNSRLNSDLRAERVISMAAAVIVNGIAQLHKADRDGYCEHCTGIKYPCQTKQIMEGTK